MRRKLAILSTAILVSSFGAAACGVQQQVEDRAREEVNKRVQEGREQVEKKVQEGQKQVEKKVEKKVQEGRKQVEKQVEKNTQ